MARKRLNKNIVIGMTLFSMAFIVLLAVLMLRQLEQRDPEHFVTLAREYEAHDEWRQAAGFYMQAFSRSQDPIHLVSMGRALLEGGEVTRALSAWEKALVDNPALIAAHRIRLDTLLTLSELYPSPVMWSKIGEAAKAMLSDAVQKDDSALAYAKHALGLSLIHRRSVLDVQATTDGLDALAKAVSLQPQHLDYAIDLAKAHILMGDLATGESYFTDLLAGMSQGDIETSKIHLAFARHLNRPHLASEGVDEYLNRVSMAQEHIESAIRLAEEDPEVLHDANKQQGIIYAQAWARAFQQNDAGLDLDKLKTKAITAYELSVKADNEDIETYVLLATLYRASRQYEEVINICERRLDDGFSRKGIRAARNKQLAFQLMILASQAALAKAQTADAATEPNQKDKYIMRAKQYVDDANGEYPGHPQVLTQSARIKLVMGQDREALDDLRKADAGFLSRDMVDWESKLLLSRIHLKLHEPGAAKETLLDGRTRAGAAAPLSMWLVYAQALMLNDEIDNIELDRALELVRRRDPGNAEALQIQAALLERRGRYQHAGELVQSTALRSLLHARELISQGDVEQAMQVLLDALQNDPTEPKLLAVSIQLLLAQEKVDLAQSIVEAALKIKPDDGYIRRLALVVQPDLSQAQRRKGMLALINEQEDAYERAASLADFYNRNQEFDLALAQLDEAERHLIAKDTPAARKTTSAHHRAILLSKLRTASITKNDLAMTQARDAAAKYNVDGARGQFVLGLYYMYRDEWSLAKLALRAAVDAQPTHARSLSSLAHCLHRLGDTDEASSLYHRAIRINPHEALARKGLAMLAKDINDQASYELHLAVCQRLIPNDKWVRSETELQQERADPDRAIVRYEASLSEDTDNLKTLSRLAELYEAKDELDKADDMYRRLRVLKPDERSLVVAMGKYYRRTNRQDLAAQALQQFSQSRSTPVDKAESLILLAAHQLSLRQLDKVEQTLLKAAQIATTFEVCYSLGEFYQRTAGKPAEALSWYDQAIAATDDSADIKLASIKLARVACLLSRGLDDLTGAEEGLMAFRKQYPTDVRADLWASEILSRRGHIASAIEHLSSFLLANPNHTYALFKRAQYTLSLGRLPTALKDLEHIKQIDPRALSLAPRLLLARLHFQAGRQNAQIRELESLLQDAPQSDVALEALTRAYIAQKHFSDADRVVTSRINQLADAPDPKWFVLRADISAALNDPNKALEDLKSAALLAHYSPESLMAVLDAFITYGRIDEGVTYYDSYAQVENVPSLLIGRYAELLALLGQTDKAVHTFRRAVGRALAESGQEIRVLVNLAQTGFGSIEQAQQRFAHVTVESAMSLANDRILARLYVLGGRVQEAEVLITKLLSTADTNQVRADLFTERGELYLGSGQMDLARQAYEQSLEYDETNWIVLNNLAYLLSDELGKHAEALPFAKSAVRYRDVADTLDTLGWIYVQLDRYDDAAAELTRAIRLNPDSHAAYYHLGEAYRRGQRFTEATDIFRLGQSVAKSQGDKASQEKIATSQARTAQRDHRP